MQRHFKLHHHKHTGKLIHHRHTSYWALALLVILCGGFSLSIERVSRADSLIVSATVPAPMPSGAPSFTSPSDGHTTTKPDVLFAGTCPVIHPAVIIAVYMGTSLLGSSECSPDGTFSVSGALYAGTQTITAKVVTITGQFGETSAPLQVTYTPPAPTPAPTPTPTPMASKQSRSLRSTVSSPTQQQSTTPSTDNPAPANAVVITPERPFVAYRPGVNTMVSVAFTGGTTPYTVTLDWGDGTVEIKTVASHEAHSFSHTYGTTGSYLLAVTAVDAVGVIQTTHYAVVDLSPKVASTGSIAGNALDAISSHPLAVPLIIYTSLLSLVATLWRYEHTHYRQRVGIPTHYRWQHKNIRHK